MYYRKALGKALPFPMIHFRNIMYSALAVVMLMFLMGLALIVFANLFCIPSPARQDYSFHIEGDYSLNRSGSGQRAIVKPIDPGSSSYLFVVEPDVKLLGWNDEVIVCYQDCAEDNCTSGWWIILLATDHRIGPMHESEYKSKLVERGVENPERIYHTPEAKVSSFGIGEQKRKVFE